MEFGYILGINLGLMKSSGVMKCSEASRCKPAAALTAGDGSEMPPAHPRVGKPLLREPVPCTTPGCGGFVALLPGACGSRVCT